MQRFGHPRIRRLFVKDNLKNILNSYQVHLVNKDWERLQLTSYTLYKSLKEYPTDLECFTSEYLAKKCPIPKQRVLAQLRLSGQVIVLLANNNFTEIDCDICNMRAPEDLNHFLFICPQYSALRSHWLQNLLLKYNNSTNCLLNTSEKQEVAKIFYYVQGALKLRSFLRNE